VLKYIFEGEDDYNQHKWVTRMAKMAYSDYGADWVINNDVDEFWWPTTGTLRDTLGNTSPEFNILEAKRSNYVLVADDERPFYQRMVYREKQSLNSLGKPLPPKVAHHGCGSVIVAQGNHSVTGIANPLILCDKIEIFHFPIRSYKQISNKIEKGGAAYERNVELDKSIGSTWRILYSEYRKNNSLLNYYESQLNDIKKIQEKIASDKIVVDRRLSDYLSAHIR